MSNIKLEEKKSASKRYRLKDKGQKTDSGGHNGPLPE